ncbi:MAG: bifunctional phosphoglucose/phosphomannose isomerase [Chloroflexi bacterium]|nr:bifunctional phosphoglucose/phosphomannose isomerase [Chloroflexota bacterium]
MLDQPELYDRFDPSRLRQRIAELPDQCQQAWEEGSAFSLPKTYASAQAVLVAGMGGSAIGGDLLAGLAGLEEAPPIHVVRDYILPSWVGPKTLVIASSYSGNTEETLSAYRQARERGAPLVAMTSGGTLAEEATRHNTPLFVITYQGEPRSAVGYSFIVPLALVCKLGLLADKAAQLREGTGLLRDLVSALNPEVPEAQNLAKTVAGAMHGKLPVVYGAGFLTAVARRWKTQLNENSKVWAFYEPLPELNHNAVQGYRLPAEIRERVYVTLLHSYFLHSRMSLRYQSTQDLLEREGVAHRQLDGVGESPLAHLLTTLLLGDYISYYLGILNQVDPAPVPVIDYLKEQLAEG